MDETPVINYVGNVFGEVITAINALQETGHSEVDINAVLRRMGVSYGADRSRADRIEMTLNLLTRHGVLTYRWFRRDVMYAVHAQIRPEDALRACTTQVPLHPVAALEHDWSKIHIKGFLDCGFCAYYDGSDRCLFQNKYVSTNAGTGVCDDYEPVRGQETPPPPRHRVKSKRTPAGHGNNDLQVLAPKVEAAVIAIVNEHFDKGQLHLDVRWVCKNLGSPGEDPWVGRMVKKILTALAMEHFLEETVSKSPKHYRILKRVDPHGS